MRWERACACGPCMPASNKIQFSYLNSNLVVPEIDALTLTLTAVVETARSLEKDSVSSIASSSDGFDHGLIASSPAMRPGKCRPRTPKAHIR
jgi:hypothetical protein